MLPTIEIALRECCNLDGVCVGHTLAYDLGRLRSEASKENANLDSFLTARIAHVLDRKPPRPKLLFWLMLTGEMALLTITNRKGSFVVPGLIHIPGYFESGDQYLNEDARPYILWNGQITTRVFMLPEAYDPAAHYACDLGTKSPLVGRVDEDTYFRIKINPVKNWELCPIPQNEDAVVTVDARKTLLSYAIGTFGSSNAKL
jgi:hypothetical protein